MKLSQLIKTIYNNENLEITSIEYGDGMFTLQGITDFEEDIYKFQNRLLNYRFFKNFNHDFIKLNNNRYEFHIDIEVEDEITEENCCQEYKSQILLLISLIIFSFIIYSLVLSPFQNYLQKRERVSSLEIKTRKEMKQNQANNQRYKKLLEELEETEKYYSNLEEKTKKKSFKNISSFEKFISEKSNFYNLTIETIGRVEKISETDKIYIPYIISGDISDIFLFIEELENSDKKISFTDSITQISTLPQGRLTTKISSNVLNITNKDIKEEKFFPISKLNNQKITKIKYLNFNNRIYIICKL